jgi:hypothetical protein
MSYPCMNKALQVKLSLCSSHAHCQGLPPILWRARSLRGYLCARSPSSGFPSLELKNKFRMWARQGLRKTRSQTGSPACNKIFPSCPRQAFIVELSSVKYNLQMEWLLTMPVLQQADLIHQLESHDLDTTGRKQEMVDRLLNELVEQVSSRYSRSSYGCMVARRCRHAHML